MRSKGTNRHRRKRIRLSLFILCAILFLSCQQETAYFSFQPVPITGWTKKDTLVFTLPPTLESGQYRMDIGVRHTTQYAYRDLWLYIRFNLCDSIRPTNDERVHLFLAREDGRWNGTGISGNYQSLIAYPNILNIKINDSINEIRITHAMLDNPLKDIKDIGIRLRKNQ
ncbi:MAG: gliding motility lipoprotein GldH [Phocaeicola sp.]|nr:gliding motility lipoprotein GldH [Phocaeicola sp.]